MLTVPAPLVAQSGISITDLFVQTGAVASALAALGLLLVLPLYLNQRRDIQRLLLWQRLEPHCGEKGGEEQWTAQATASAEPSGATGGHPGTGELTPAQRVTADRPALERITAERAAIGSPSFLRRLIAGGPRHPVLISLLALVLAACAIAAVAVTGSGGGEEAARGGGGIERSEVPVAVLNASSATGLAGRIAGSLREARFERIQTGVTATSQQTLVLFAPRERRAAQVVARVLGVTVVQPIDRRIRATAPGAEVVVVAGEDQVRS